MSAPSELVTIGIDAINIRQGGGISHLRRILDAAQPELHGVARVVVWGSAQTLAQVQDRDWLIKVIPAAAGGGLIRRSGWQRFSLSQAARDAGCHVLFIPGGSYSGTFRPVVAMFRNMLPFDARELSRYGWSIYRLKLLLLRFVQRRTLTSADGVIFLHPHALSKVREVAGSLRGRSIIVPHGSGRNPRSRPRVQQPIAAYSERRAYRVLYLSSVDHYKHTWHVVEAVAELRKHRHWPLTLDLVGPAFPAALRRLRASLRRHDPSGLWARYHGRVTHAEVDSFVAEADLGVFASSCENLPQSLLEIMAAGLPIACSNRSPMPEILGVGGQYFDPEQPGEIMRALESLITSTSARASCSAHNIAAAENYSWTRCAADTLEFLARIARGKDDGALRALAKRHDRRPAVRGWERPDRSQP